MQNGLEHLEALSIRVLLAALKTSVTYQTVTYCKTSQGAFF